MLCVYKMDRITFINNKKIGNHTAVFDVTGEVKLKIILKQIRKIGLLA